MRITVVNSGKELVANAENQEGIVVWHEVQRNPNGEVNRRFTHILSPNQHTAKEVATLFHTILTGIPPGVSSLTREDLVPYTQNYVHVSVLKPDEIMGPLETAFGEKQ